MTKRESFRDVGEILNYLCNNILEFDGMDITSVNQKGIFGNYPLLIIIEQDSADEIALNEAKLLIDAGADVNCRGEMGETPLHSSALRGRGDIAKLLIKSGATSGLRDKFGRTASDIARERNFLELSAFFEGV